MWSIVVLNVNNRWLSYFQFVVQGVGAVFAAVFLAAYLFALPTSGVLHSVFVYHELLAVFGTLFLILVFAAIAVSAIIKSKD